MRIWPVANIDSPDLAIFRELRHSPRAEQHGLFIAEGHLLVQRLVASQYQLHSAVIVDTKLDAMRGLLPDHVPLFVVPHGLISELVGFQFHRGILAAGYRQPMPTAWGLLSKLRDGSTSPELLVLCPEIQDPENLGTILRASAAFGANLVVVGPACPDPFSRRVLRVSMGASLSLPMARQSDFMSLLQQLRQHHDFQTLAAVLDADAAPVEAVEKGRRIALLLGREDRGLPRELVDACTQRVTVRMRPGTDSLNVAMAATVLLHQLTSHSSGCQPVDSPLPSRCAAT